MSEQKPTPSEFRNEAREEVTLFVEYEGADDLLGDYTENLSSGGTFVATSRDLEIGTQVTLVLQFPGLLKPLPLEGIVRWKREGEAGCGIEFINGVERVQLAEVMSRISCRDPATMHTVWRILIVEDNVHIANLIHQGLLSSKSFGDQVTIQCSAANNGKQACTMLAEARVDALIIDMYLPSLDGSDVIAHARNVLKLSKLPIIAVSGGGEAARKLAFAAGANVFLDKPMRLKQVVETMQRLLASDVGR